MSVDVSVIGLGRVGLPLALCFADRGLRVHRRRQRPRAAARPSRPARCRSRRPGAQELLERVRASGRLALSDRVADAAQAEHDRDHARHAVVLAHRDRHARHPLGARRPAARACATGHSLVLRSTVAPGTTDFVAGYLEQAPRLRGRRGRVRRPRARADRRRALPRGDRHAAVHRRRRRRALRASTAARAVRACSARRSCRPRRCRPSWRRSGPTSCATRRSRCPTC